jgi:hypothetical protein
MPALENLLSGLQISRRNLKGRVDSFFQRKQTALCLRRPGKPGKLAVVIVLTALI